MASGQNIITGTVLGYLRRVICLCGLLVGVSLLAQMLIWALATFTELRWTEADSTEAVPLIVQSDLVVEPEPDSQDPADLIRAATGTDTTDYTASNSDAENSGEDTLENRVASTMDGTFAFLFRCTRGLGSAGMIAMMPLLMLGVLVGASSRMRGCEKTVSAFTLALLVAMIVLPLGDVMSMPWSYGALSSYEHMTMRVDAFRDGPAQTLGPFVFYSRFLVMPLAALIGLALVYLRFSASVELTILAGDEFLVDEETEMEASNVKVGAHGSQTSRAFSSAVAQPGAPAPPAPSSPVATPLATPASVATTPKRLI